MNTQEIKITNAQTISINAKLQDKLVIPTLEQQEVLPDANYNGLSKVIVDAVSLESKIVNPNRDTQFITPTETLGLSSVTIEPVALETKTVTPTKEIQVLNPSDEFIGFSQVTVEKIPEEYIIPEGNLDITKNGDYDVSDNATVNIDVQSILQDKTVEVKPLENKNIIADDGYNGLGVVNVVGVVDTENIEITPTKETQTINRSEDKYIESVTVNPIPDNFIEPSGELDITENGSYDVTNYASAKVETSGVDINEYFVTSFRGGTMYWVRDNFYYKAPDLNITDEGNTIAYLCANAGTIIPKVICGDNIIDYSYLYQNVTATDIDISGLSSNNVKYMQYMFSGCSKLTSLNFNNFNTSVVTNMSYMFKSCSKLTILDLSMFDTTNVTNMTQMFYGCSGLTTLDIRNFDFTNVTSYTNIFYNVLADCEIIVKDDTARDWILAIRSDFTNIKTVAELEA